MVVVEHRDARVALEGEAVHLALALHRLNAPGVILGEIELLLGNKVVHRPEGLLRGEVVDSARADRCPHGIADGIPRKEDRDLLEVVLAREALVLDLDVGELLHEERHLLLVEDDFLISGWASAGMEGDLDRFRSLRRFRSLGGGGRRNRRRGWGRRRSLGGFGLRWGRRCSITAAGRQGRGCSGDSSQ